MEKKITKAQIMEVVKANVENMVFEGTDVTAEDVVAFVDTTLQQMENRKAKDKERRAEKIKAADELVDKITAVLTNELQDIDTITAAIEVEGITRSKVIPRLTRLIEDRVAVKDFIKVGKDKKTAYKLAETAPEEE